MRSRHGSRGSYRSLFFIVLVLIFFNHSLSAQYLVSGKVSGKDGIGLPGASILNKGRNISTLSDTSGRFTIEAVNGNLLEFSFIGYQKVEYLVNSSQEITIALSQEIVNLEDVVLLGYGTSLRKDVTGAVSKITSKDFNGGIVTNPLLQIQGKVAGLIIMQPGGDPNQDFFVRLRGATSLEGQPPLLVVDGVAIDDFSKTVSTINPADIESYDVLKDASASAIYGSRGANGVILITTKKGRSGKIQVEYNGYIGTQTATNEVDLLSGDQWRKATAGMNAEHLDEGGNTNWQKAISRTAYSQSHLVSVSGGSEKFNFRGSVGYFTQEGIRINTGKKQLTARLSAEQKSVDNKLYIRYSIYSSLVKRDLFPDQSTTSQSNGGSFIFGQTMGYLPVWPVHNSDGTYYQPPANIFNPVFLLKELHSKKRENFFQPSVRADYSITKEFTLGFAGAFSINHDIYDRFWPAIPGTPISSEAEKSNDNKENFTGDFHINYQKNFNKHSVNATGVYEYNQFRNDGFRVIARGYQVSALLNNNLSTATSVTPNDIRSYRYDTKLISFLGRLVYSYDGRYIVTANFRRDGSSKFGPNYRWGNFPSIALAWRASNESFLQNVDWLDNLKLRASYGYTGNQENLPPNTFQQLYAPAGPFLYGGQVNQSYAAVRENNPDLKWEVRKSFNVGIDFSLFRNRLFGTVDVFSDKTSDMLFLYDLPQPPFLSNNVFANAASATNNGVEITLGASVIKGKNFTWNVQGNIATLNNKITNLLGKFKGADLTLTNRHYGYAFGGGFGGTNVTELKIGYPAGVFWIPIHAGLDSNGRELFNNYDTTGKFTGVSNSFTDQDRVFIDPTSRYTWGITNNFNFRQFDLGFFLRGVQGQKIFANYILNVENANYLPNSNISEKGLSNGFSEYPMASSYWLKSGSFVRLENITLGYNIEKLKGFRHLRIYLTATNVFVITNYEGIDPEINTDGSQRYIDQNYYPKSRGFVLGLNATF